MAGEKKNIRVDKRKGLTKRERFALISPDTPLTRKQLDFCIAYLESGDGKAAAIKAGYSPRSAVVTGSEMLLRPNVGAKLKELAAAKEARKTYEIASGQEVMEYFTQVMQGKIQDQFGLEAPLSERTKAAIELAKRTVDIQNRQAGTADAQVKISLDWNL